MEQSQEFPIVYGTQRLVTAFTRARHWSLSWDRCIQSTTTQIISMIIHCYTVFPSIPMYSEWSLPCRFSD